MSKVILKYKDSVLKEFYLAKDETRIGRNPENDICIDNQLVSGVHARILRENNQFYIEDLNSLNGTFMDGTKIGKMILENKAEIIIGKHILNFISELISLDEKILPSQRKPIGGTIIIDPKLKEAMTSKKKELSGGLVVTKGSLDKHRYELKEQITRIGKDNKSDIRIKGLFVPGFLALIEKSKGGYFIIPVSKRKIKVNDEKLKNRCELNDGDILKIRNIELKFYIEKLR